MDDIFGYHSAILIGDPPQILKLKYLLYLYYE